MPLGAMIALNEAGLKVPDDISLIGFEKLDQFGSLDPNLALVKQPQNAIGECTANQMLALLGRGDAAPLHQVITLPTQLFEADGVRRPNKPAAGKPYARAGG